MADVEGIEGLLAPTRVLLVIGLVLVACGPLRAAMFSPGAGVARWAAVLSAALALTTVLLPGLFHPAANPWLERPSWFRDRRAVAHGRRRLPSDTADHGGPIGMARRQRPVSRTGRRSHSHTCASATTRPSTTKPTSGSRTPTGETAAPWSRATASNGFPTGRRTGPGSSTPASRRAARGWPAGPAASKAAGGQIGPGFLFGQPSPVREYAHIWRVRADGTGSPEQITNVDADDRAATYSPDGSQLAFDSTRDGTTRVYVMDADGSDVRRLTDGGDDWGATWSPDGRWIAYRLLGRNLRSRIRRSGSWPRTELTAPADRRYRSPFCAELVSRR